jgi:hypothetical protein
MKKLLIAVAFLTGCLSEAPAPDETPTTDGQAESSASQDLAAPPNFDMQAWLRTINPRTCGAPPHCTIGIPGECGNVIPTSCGHTCVHVPGGQVGVGVCGTIEQ